MTNSAADIEVVAPGSVAAVLDLLAAQPGVWTPIAGGTELMVQFGSGHLDKKRLIDVWRLPELSRIEPVDGGLRIGAGATFTEIRYSDAVRNHFPQLAECAAWIGGVANQNRATLAGNIVNGSPAADSPPALLIYDAQIELVSKTGARTIPYTLFHTGYKRNAMEPDELVSAILLQFPPTQRHQYTRKVGTRRAQAISKVVLAGSLSLDQGEIRDVRIALASVAPTPVRCAEVEALLEGKPLTIELIEEAVSVLGRSIQPIDDIRSTAAYRQGVSANLLREFLTKALQ